MFYCRNQECSSHGVGKEYVFGSRCPACGHRGSSWLVFVGVKIVKKVIVGMALGVILVALAYGGIWFWTPTEMDREANIVAYTLYNLPNYGPFQDVNNKTTLGLYANSNYWLIITFQNKIKFISEGFVCFPESDACNLYKVEILKDDVWIEVPVSPEYKTAYHNLIHQYADFFSGQKAEAEKEALNIIRGVAK